MSEQAGMPGELIYDHIVQIKQVTEYGVSLNPLLSGAAPPPAEGARFDIHVEGTATGPKLKGAVKGVDYINLRAEDRAVRRWSCDSEAGIAGRAAPR